MNKFLIKTLGCKVNSYESEFIRTLFLKEGYIEVEENADVVIVNTCTVTNTADNKSKKIINNIRKTNKTAILIAIGCFTQYRKEEINNLIDADIILGNKNKSKILEYINEYQKTKKRIIDFYDMSNQDFEDMDIEKYEHHKRAFIKIQDGCNNFCSYCIIPYVRGRVRSKEFNKCIAEFKKISKTHKEIVLSGIHTGMYESDNKKLSDLILEMSKIDNIKRIRLSSVEIVELNNDMLEIIKNNHKFVSHLHIPLQSGSDEILRLMNRRYDTNYFENKVNEIRKNRPNISLTTDVIVGFPEETDKLFEKTYEFCKKMKFSKIHVFPYSNRFGTVASKMQNQIPNEIKKQRVHKLLELSIKMENEYYESFINKTVSVLIEEFKDGYYYGFTDNYIPVKIKGNYNLNEIYDICLERENINFNSVIQ